MAGISPHDEPGGPIPPPGLPEDGDSLADRLVAWLCYGGAAIAALSVLISLATTGYSVLMRYVLGTPITWIDELSGYLVVAIVMFGAAEALRRGDHIRVDLLTASLRGRSLMAARIVWMVMVIAVMGALLASGWTAVTFSYDFGMYSEGYLEMPMWIPQSMLIAGALLVLAAAGMRIFNALRARDEAGESPPQ